MKQLKVHFLPELVAADELAGGTSVVIDVLRATTTIVHALAAGATAVVPCATIEEARRRAAAFPAGTATLGGERGGMPIEGFDLGNSPAEYTRAAVGGKTVILTTTNGTQALLHCRQAAEIVVGAFVNLSAVCGVLSLRPRVDLACAGTDGQTTDEDVLLAGAIVERLADDATWRIVGKAENALAMWRRVSAEARGGALKARLVEALRASLGGKNLIAIGMADDLKLAAEIDRFAIVPRYDPVTGRIELDNAAGRPFEA